MRAEEPLDDDMAIKTVLGPCIQVNTKFNPHSNKNGSFLNNYYVYQLDWTKSMYSVYAEAIKKE